MLRKHGWSVYRIDKAVRAGELQRPCKGWVTLDDVDPALVFAARHGLVISCITQAKRLGLWVRENAEPHFAVPRPGAVLRPESCTLHWRKPLVPRDIHTLEDPIENLLDNVAHCVSFEDAVAVWDSALNQRLVDIAGLAQYPLRGPAKAVLAAASPFADSGLESYVRLRLGWIGEPIIYQAWLHGHRVDFLIGERLVLQIDGGHHVGAQRSRDIQHDAELRLRGYTVIRASYDQIMNHWPTLQAFLMRAIAQGLHRA